MGEPRWKLLVEMVFYAGMTILGGYQVAAFLNGTREWWWAVLGLILISYNGERLAERWREL